MDKIKSGVFTGLNCPIPKTDYDKILQAHGGGGALSNNLIRDFFLTQFDNELLNQQHDGATFDIGKVKLAFTTDTYVVNPIFFPGGDIGCLAVNGTVNDLCMCGAKPLYISLAFILEEGFPVEDLWKIVLSVKMAADIAGVKIATGDTKVVERGKGDKIFINTSGIGTVFENVNISPKRCRPGDLIILNGNIAEHGTAIISAREEFGFRSNIKSDTAPLNTMIDNLTNNLANIHMMRDPTRGGISSSLNEIASASNLGIEIEESKIPVSEEVKAMCELLGFDPLYVANEGKMLVFLPEENSQEVLRKMRSNPLGEKSQIIGKVVDGHPGTVVMKTLIGTKRIVDMLSGEQLPRIC